MQIKTSLLAVTLSACAFTSMAAMNTAEFKEVLALKQQYMVTQPHIASAITVTEQVFMIECGRTLTKGDILTQMGTPGFGELESEISRTKGVIGIYSAKEHLIDNLKLANCLKES